ncbi:MAG: hypothetical protein IKB12_04900 [Clostridia bacterium]|nr:hypothetical protein [Clostridia bacterium]
MENDLKKVFLGIPAYTALSIMVIMTCFPVWAAYSMLGMKDKADGLLAWIVPFVDDALGIE